MTTIGFGDLYVYDDFVHFKIVKIIIHFLGLSTTIALLSYLFSITQGKIESNVRKKSMSRRSRVESKQ